MNQRDNGMDEQVFAALQAYELLKADSLAINKGQTNQALSFTNIMHCARSPHTETAISTLDIINQVLDYRRKYRFILNHLAQLQSPKQAAASNTAAQLMRKSEQYEITIDVNQANKVIVSVKFNPALVSEGPKRVHLHCEYDDTFYHLGLSEDAKYHYANQIEQGGTMFAALTHPSSHMYVVYE
ncbi:hypothetical protein KJ365_00810 [Glaciecola sp. XM2]|jgi:Fic family protein|uniref:hypothetical protein n=1 Tax=Glaciecola sp. XM2 TaxID=1914931 RepID=UPI001BDEA868|nr:hypothetical protein [Glaciecola sp. XM2]MBT1449407.1 hypothetical protein [Glaciecola sp. XM2]